MTFIEWLSAGLGWALLIAAVSLVIGLLIADPPWSGRKSPWPKGGRREW